MRHSERLDLPRSRRIAWPGSAAGWLAILAIAAAFGGGRAEAAGPALSTARVVAVEGPVVVLGAGRLDGLTEASQVTLLRDGEPIVHPLTGEVLGTPQEPVGTVHVYEVSDRRARGGMVKVYSDPQIDDLAEFERVAVREPASEPPQAVAEVMRKVEELEGSVAQYRRNSEDLRSYPAFARRVWDEVASMKSYLVSLDERLVELEEQQSEDHFRLSSVLSGEYQREDLKEFTIRYTPDTRIRLQAAGKTLLISVVRDSLRLEDPAVAAQELSEYMDDLSMEPEEPEPSDGEEPWYKSEWHLAGGAGLLFALLIMVTLIIRRRYNDVMEGLDDFDDEFLDEEEEEEEED